MQIQHSDFATKASIRCSLKRGLARQAMRHAEATEADLPRIVALAAAVRPNLKSLQRLAVRVQGQIGVVRVALTSDGAGVIAFVRNVRQVRTQVEAREVFTEAAIVYTRMEIRCSWGVATYRISRASFCLHALERLVERSDVVTDRPLLTWVDSEALQILRAIKRGQDFQEDGDHFVPAIASGVWAGSVDAAGLEEDWGLTSAGPDVVPFFSARTFLSMDQMRPTVWLRCCGDHGLLMAK
ncbi:hypothetical protein [Tabrizicola sp. BL-A-41-H6]|uniref:hypothetical protein n=1 Tax=Tabrizicola sp. BL-A-41-H6 TaxID=3421107 RepID=UPI003D66E91C